MFFILTSMGQNLEKHQWKNRILLVFTNDLKSEKLQKQIEILSKEKEGLKDRKLIIYRFSKYLFTINFNTVWFSSTLDLNKYKKVSENFKVVLIGLDGNVKMKVNDILSAEKLFSIIDGMPMRSREINIKNK